MRRSNVEHERTWLVRRVPDPLPAGTPIRQGYLAHDGTVAVRIRRRGPRPVATVKGGAGASRVEVEWDLATAELDVFDGALSGLMLVDVEFDDEDSMAAFAAPDWFGPEVTDDPRYTNVSLAEHGLPHDHPPGLPER